jgi:hypothetical protein
MTQIIDLLPPGVTIESNKVGGFYGISILYKDYWLQTGYLYGSTSEALEAAAKTLIEGAMEAD